MITEAITTAPPVLAAGWAFLYLLFGGGLGGGVLDQPALGDIQYQDHGGDDEEHAELVNKVPQIAPGQGIVEGLVPSVELDLSVGGRDDHRDGGHNENDERFSDGRTA